MNSDCYSSLVHYRNYNNSRFSATVSVDVLATMSHDFLATVSLDLLAAVSLGAATVVTVNFFF